MKRFIFSIIILITVNLVYGQHSLSGKIVDKADNKPLTNASVVLLNQDSILTNFTRVDEDGNFNFKGLEGAPYILIVSYPKFELISRPIKIEDRDLKLSPIALNSQANLIEEVVVQQKLPIRIKGDTLEYDAASFETEKNAKLEDLLRRLPGLSVSGDGKITANGKSVSKVLIDGEEFFGYDPKIAIRNIRADAVDKVQVYEKKSKEAELTGIDDGVREVTVNAVLKEEARQGIFGNMEALAGTSGLYTGSLFAAKFDQTERIGITANSNNMGGGFGGYEGSLRMNSQIYGDPKSTSAGANYENQFFNRKMNLNANYNFNNNSNRNEQSSYNKEILPENAGIRESNNENNSKNSNQSHGLRSEARLRIDSTSNMEIQLGANRSTNYNSNESEQYVSIVDQGKESDYKGRNETNGQSSSTDVRINYRKRLNKRGSSINMHFSNNYSQNNSESLVYQETYRYNDKSTSIINQNRAANGKGNDISGQLNYSDRIAKMINYTVGYSINNQTNANQTNAYKLVDGSSTNTIDSLYSQDQNTTNTGHSILANLSYFNNSFSVNLSNRSSLRAQSLTDGYHNIDLNRSYWDNDINTNINYKLSNRKNISLTYSNRYNIPTFGQLQQIQPQTNELFVQKGNPDLKRSNVNMVNVNYNSMSFLKGTNWMINGTTAITKDPIVNQSVYDTITKVTTSSYINVKGKSMWSAQANAMYNMPVFAKQAQLRLFSGAGYSNGFSYSKFGNSLQNQQFALNNLENINFSFGTSINEQNSKGLDYEINLRGNINNQKNSLNEDLNYTNFGAGGSTFLKYFLPKTFNISTNINYSFEGPTKLYTKSIHQFYTNIELSKKLLKNESLVASVKAFDVFNTFNNINRSMSDTNFSESTQMMLTRYILFGLKWDFNKNLGKKKND